MILPLIFVNPFPLIIFFSFSSSLKCTGSYIIPLTLHQWTYKTPTTMSHLFAYLGFGDQIQAPMLVRKCPMAERAPHLVCLNSFLFDHTYIFTVCDDQRQHEGVWYFPSTLFVFRTEHRWSGLLVSIFIPHTVSPALVCFLYVDVY